MAGAANTPQAIAKRYATGGVALKLENVDKFWGIKHELAKGRFSVIKRCLDAKTKKPYVAKIIKYDDDTDRDDSLQEFDIHRSIKGDKVVMLRDAFLMRKYIVLIMDLLEGQDILSFVASKPRPNEEDVAFVIRPLLDVVNYLHGQQIVHLDIRPANIFIAKSNLGLKLIDYGSARRIKNWKEGDMLAIVSYAAFTAPELLDFTPVSGGADMWSIGVLLYALLSGILPFAVECKEDEDEDEKISEAVKRGKWSFDSKAFNRSTSEVKDFITALLSFDAKKRPTAEEAMKNPWLQGDNLQKRRSSDINASKLKDLSQQLMKKDKEDVVTASCVLRTFNEDPYDSPESDEE